MAKKKGRKPKKPKAILREKIFVPYHRINEKKLKKHFHINHFDEKGMR